MLPFPLDAGDDDDDNLAAYVDRLAPRDLHVQHAQIDKEITERRARLNLLLNGAVHEEVARIGEVEGSGGVLLIASAAGVPDTALWDLLAGRYQPTAEVWQRIERIFTMCRAGQDGRAALTARRHFERIAYLTRAQDLIAGRQPARRALAIAARQVRNGSEASSADGQRSDDVPGLPEPQVAPPIPDVIGHDQCPNPMQAKTPAQFVDAMNAYRAWAGNPSLRELERRCAKKLSYSSFRNMLNQPALPKLSAVEVFVRSLGGASDDLQRWATAWRKLTKEPR